MPPVRAPSAVDPIAALIAFLNADTAVTTRADGRVFGGQVPPEQNQLMPRYAVVLRPAGGGQLVRGYQQYGDIRVDVDCHGQTLRDAWLLHLDVKGSLKQMARTVQAGVLLHWARISADAVTTIDPRTEWPVAASSWQLMASEVPV